MKIFDYYPGNLPILVSMPHNGEAIPDDIAVTMADYTSQVIDTDWYLDRLYAFAKNMGCSILNPVYSRYVIDLNRPENNESLYPGADTTELCPTSQFDRQPIYLAGMAPSQQQIEARIETYWRPYHQQLQQAISNIKAQFGYVLLFEAHSIKSVVPRFFEGKLPDFNFGNFDGKSSSNALSELISAWQPAGYSKVFNARFKGGYITRQYGNPEQSIDSLQLELSQATYLNEDTLQYDESKANAVIVSLNDLFEQLRIFCLDRSGM